MRSERAPGAYWYERLQSIPTHFGRLVHCGMMQDLLTGRYRHDGLAQIWGEQAAHEAIAECHMRIFREWLLLNLPEQRVDLLKFMADKEQDSPELLTYWRDEAPYERLVPRVASEAERVLYREDIRILVETIRAGRAIAATSPGA